MIPLAPDVVRIWLPPDANSLLSIADHCLRSRDHVNLIVVDKQPHLQYLDLERGPRDTAPPARRSGTGPAPRTRRASEPDVVLACAGDVPTQETLAAAELLREHVPDLRVRVVNVVDLMALLPVDDHPHGVHRRAVRRPVHRRRADVVFAFHGYPRAVHQLLHGRPNADRFHVRGFNEQGTTTTPFDMVVLNRMSRYHLVLEALRRAAAGPTGGDELRRTARTSSREHDLHPRAPRGHARGAGWTWRGQDA